MKDYAFRLWLIVIIMALIFGCASDDDDDTDSADDDDDDSVADDDDNDIDADDDDDDTTEPTWLLVVGTDDNGETSWLQGLSGWTNLPIPKPAGPARYRLELGPIFFYQGEKGYAAWNTVLEISELWFFMTLGHHWLVFDPATGWSLDTAREPAGALMNVDTIFSPEPDSFWAKSHIWASQYFELFYEETLFQFTGLTSNLSFLSASITADYFLSDDSGLMAVNADGDKFVRQWNGSNWAPWNYPELFHNGDFIWIRLDDMENGLLLWKSGSQVSIVALQQGAFLIQNLPSGCTDMTPRAMFGEGDQAIVIEGQDDYYLQNYRFIELRDGEWLCRNLGTVDDKITPTHGLVLADGREFISARSRDAASDFLFEITATQAVEVALPADLKTIHSIHAIGPAAPKYSRRPRSYFGFSSSPY